MIWKFRKTRKRILFLILILTSLAALLSDVSATFGKTPAGEVLLRFSYPFVKAAHVMRQGAYKAGAAVFESRRLKEENRSLKERLSQKTLQQALTNSRINALEKSLSFYDLQETRGQWKYKILPARIVARSPNPWAKTILIDKGARQGALIEQTVMNEMGIIGVIQDTTRDMSRAQLLIDQRSAVIVRIKETGELGALYGVGRADFLLLEAEGTGKGFEKDDHVITAGLSSSLFPENIPIGTIEKVERDKYGRIRARVKPSINFEALDVAFILLGSERGKVKDIEDSF